MTFVVSQPVVADPADGEMLITDFTPRNSDVEWFVVNDNVMGGRSRGGFETEEGVLRFTGSTNTNGGGFSSIRTQPVRFDLSSHAGIRLKVKGDGRRYTWRLTTDARFRGRLVSFWADFDTEKGKWTTVDIPFENFEPKFRGFELNGPPPDPANISGMGLMIYDNRDGPFEMHVERVSAYSDNEPFALEQYQWSNRVLVVNASHLEDEQLQAQWNELASTTDEFADRDMVLVTLLDDAVSTADGRELTNADVAAARQALDIRDGSFALRLVGKDGSVKLSSEKATPMSEIYDLIDAMPMRRREIADSR